MAKDPRALLQQAEALRKSGQLSDAIDACLKALETQPGLDALRVTLGRTYLESGQSDLARNTLQEVFARLPEHHLAGKLLAEAQKETGDRSAAEATCLALLQTYPRDRDIEALLKTVREETAGSAAPAAAAPAAVAPAAAARSTAAAVAPTPDVAGRPAAIPARAVEAVPAPRAATVEPVADPQPDYVPEDVAGGAPEATPPRAATPDTVVPPAGAATSPLRAPAPPPAPVAPAPEVPPAAPRAPARDALQTNTLAELYVKQGLIDRAIEVYRGMLKVDPANDRARARLEELQASPAPGTTAAVAPPAPRPSPVLVVPVAAAPAPAPAAAAPRVDAVDPAVVARAAAIRRLEEWLARMQRGRDAGGRMGR